MRLTSELGPCSMVPPLHWESPFTPPPGPGEYQFTPGCNTTNISVPGWGNVTPFTVSDPDYFPTATRPAVTDPEWLVSLEEVRAYGASDSTVRTAVVPAATTRRAPAIAAADSGEML